MKTLVLGGIAAAAMIADTPAIAQTTAAVQPAPNAHAGKGAWAHRVITRAEVERKVREQFARMDTNRDGYITREEANAAREAMRSRMQQRMAQRQARGGQGVSLFDRLDTNRDGQITRAEVEAARAARQTQAGTATGRRGGDMARLFERFDTNRDGVITRAEFDAARNQMRAQRQARGGDRMAKRGGGHRMGMGFTGQMFELADANRDGRVSLQEAVDAALQRFDAADLNRDGQVTPDERMQMRQRTMQERSPG